MRRSVIAVTAAVALLAAACQDDGDVEPIEPDDQAAESEEPEPEPEPEGEDPQDPFAVPDEIDVDYAQQVFDELFRIQGDAYRLTYEQRDEVDFVPVEALDSLRSISVDEDEFAERSQVLQNDLDRDFSGRNIPLADRAFEVEELSRADARCIVAEGQVDFRVTSEDPDREVVPHSYALVRDEEANETGWVFRAETAVLEDFGPLDPEEVCP